MLVGAPAYARSWILPAWYSHVLIAAREAEINDLAFVFVVERTDEETISCIEQLIRLPTKLVLVDQKLARDDHQWNDNRYHEMVFLRNTLLETVRGIDPDLFLSLDTDILLHPKALKNLIEDLEFFDAVGGKCYMTEVGNFAPSYSMLSLGGNLMRPDAHGVMPVDCIMALKLMTQPAFYTDYKFDHLGEDIGFSKNCKQAGLRLGWDGRVTSKHVMNREKLNDIDERCGF